VCDPSQLRLVLDCVGEVGVKLHSPVAVPHSNYYRCLTQYEQDRNFRIITLVSSVWFTHHVLIFAVFAPVTCIRSAAGMRIFIPL